MMVMVGGGWGVGGMMMMTYLCDFIYKKVGHGLESIRYIRVILGTGLKELQSMASRKLGMGKQKEHYTHVVAQISAILSKLEFPSLPQVSHSSSQSANGYNPDLQSRLTRSKLLFHNIFYFVGIYTKFVIVCFDSLTFVHKVIRPPTNSEPKVHFGL